MVAFKDSNRKNKFFIHFDKPYAGVTTEKVDLKDSNIRIMFQRVKYCTCSQCATTAEGQCLLPLTDAGVSLAVAQACSLYRLAGTAARRGALSCHTETHADIHIMFQRVKV